MAEIEVDGLPNLPKLARKWQPAYYYPELDPATWIPAVPGDSQRWSINFVAPLGKSLLVTTAPTDDMTIGWFINSGQDKTFDYQTYGPIVGDQWYAFGFGAVGKIQVYTAPIVKRK